MEEHWEPLGVASGVYTTAEAGVGTDSLLLAAFALPRRGERVCDLCAGNGVLPLTWFADPVFWDRGVTVDAVELEPGAADRLSRAVARAGLAGRVRPVRADLRDLRDVLPAGAYDRVTVNPPYFQAVPAGGRGTPLSAARRMARFEAGPDQPGCTLGDTALTAARLLKNGGRFCLCHRPERLTDLLDTLRGAGLEPKRLHLLGAGDKTSPFLLLCEAVKGGGPGLTIEWKRFEPEKRQEEST